MEPRRKRDPFQDFPACDPFGLMVASCKPKKADVILASQQSIRRRQRRGEYTSTVKVRPVMPRDSIARIIGYIQKCDFQIHYLHSNVMEALHKGKNKRGTMTAKIMHTNHTVSHTFPTLKWTLQLEELKGNNNRCKSFSPFPSNIWIEPRCQKKSWYCLPFHHLTS